jgi:hypothetical protein
MLYGDSQKMMEGPEILHDEFPLEDRYGMLYKYTVSVPHQKTNKEVLDLASTKPKEVMYIVNQLYRARGACFSPYRDLLRRQTRSGCARSINPVGWLQ